MKTGVVIVTYNRIDLLKECLQCVLCQDLPFNRVIIVDNASTDGTKEFLDGVKDLWKDNPKAPNPIILHKKQNLGGAGGFYAGLAEAKKYKLDYILIIDDDAMIANDYMSRIVNCAKMHPDIYGFAGRVETDGQIDATHRRLVSSKIFFSEGPISTSKYNLDKEDYTFKCDCATFCGLVIRAEVLKSFGLPKKEYFLWYDDSEFCLRLSKDGGILVVPAACLNHKTKLPANDESLLMRTSWRHYYGYRNRLDCGRIHFGKMCGFFIIVEYKILRLLSRFMLLSKNEEKKEKGAFNVEMITDVLNDSKLGVLGMNKKYHPGL